MSPAAAIRIRGLEVRYGFRTAVEGVDLTVDRGASLGLLGANGAGKTTTLHALLGFLRPRAGEVEVLGEKSLTPSVLRQVGFGPDDGCPPEHLTGREYLRFVGGYRLGRGPELDRAADDLLEWFELDPSKRVGAYSKGMRRRIVLAQALIGSPALVVLDEPLNGLDPLFILKLRERLEQFRSGGGTLLFSSHILSEVEKTCSHVAMMAKGRMVFSGEVGPLVAEFGSVEAAFQKKVTGL